MVCREELNKLISEARNRGAIVIENEYMEVNGDVYIDTIQVFNLPGVGTHPMRPIYASECLASAIYEYDIQQKRSKK